MDNDLVTYQLLNSSPEAVFEWLKNNAPTSGSRIWYEDRDDLEDALRKRSDNLINLGLALYGWCPSTGRELFKSEDEQIKKAALQGTTVYKEVLSDSWIQDEGFLQNLLTLWNDELLSSLFGNSNIPDELLIQLYERTAPFDSLSEENWTTLIIFTIKNPRLSLKYDDSIIDGWAEYEHNKVFEAAWKLFTKLEKTPRNANLLSSLSSNLVPYYHLDFDILEIAAIWKSNDEKLDDSLSLARQSLIKIIPNYDDKFDVLKEHEDLAIRKGYYSNMSYPTQESIKEGFKKDGIEFVDAAMFNKNMFVKSDTRNALREACGKVPVHGSDYISDFHSRCNYWASIHPEWFKGLFGDLPFEDIPDRDVRVEKRIEYIGDQLNDIHRSLIGERGENDYPGKYGEDSLFYDVQNELRTIGEYLGGLYKNNNVIWGWAVAGLAIGYSIGKFF